METKKLFAGAAIALIAGVSGLGAGFMIDQPQDRVEVVEVSRTVEVPVEVIKTVTEVKEVPVEVEKIVEVEKVVEVEDTDMIKLLCSREMYDDLMDCKVEIQAEEEALKLAVSEIKKEYADVLEDEGLVEDEDEVDIVRIYDDYEDIEVVRSDYDDEEYRFKIDVKVDDDEADDKIKVTFDVEVEDGEAKIRDVSLVD